MILGLVSAIIILNYNKSKYNNDSKRTTIFQKDSLQSDTISRPNSIAKKEDAIDSSAKSEAPKYIVEEQNDDERQNGDYIKFDFSGFIGPGKNYIEIHVDGKCSEYGYIGEYIVDGKKEQPRYLSCEFYDKDTGELKLNMSNDMQQYKATLEGTYIEGKSYTGTYTFMDMDGEERQWDFNFH